jgi:hypothetical protein
MTTKKANITNPWRSVLIAWPPNPRVQRTSARGFAAALAADAHSFGVKSSWFAAMKLGRVFLGRGRRPPVHRQDGVGELGKAFDSGVATQQRCRGQLYIIHLGTGTAVGSWTNRAVRISAIRGIGSLAPGEQRRGDDTGLRKCSSYFRKSRVTSRRPAWALPIM